MEVLTSEMGCKRLNKIRSGDMKRESVVFSVNNRKEDRQDGYEKVGGKDERRIRFYAICSKEEIVKKVTFWETERRLLV
jgi:hypothetical protein